MLQSAIHSIDVDMFSSGSHSIHMCSSKEQLMLCHATVHFRIPTEATSEPVAHLLAGPLMRWA